MADIAMLAMQEAIKKLQLEVNMDNPRSCHLPEQSFDFSSFTFERCCSRKTGKAHRSAAPSKRRIKRICDVIHAETGRHTMTISAEKLVKQLNFKLTGSANCFYSDSLSKAYQVADAHAKCQLRQWLCETAPAQRKGIDRFPDQLLYQTLRPVRWPGRRATALAEGMNACSERWMRRPFDERSLGTGAMVRPFRHRHTKAPDNSCAGPDVYRATFLIERHLADQERRIMIRPQSARSDLCSSRPR